MGLFTRKIERHKKVVLDQAVLVVAEDDRVYRNQVAEYAERFGSAKISAVGLAKARVFGSAFPGWAFFLRWGEKREEEAMGVLNACSGVAMIGLEEAGWSLTHGERENLGSFHKLTCQYITDELRDGPSAVVPPDSLSSGFRGLLQLSHQALQDSIVGAYPPRAREHYEWRFKSAVSGRMSVMASLLSYMGWKP